MKPLRQSRFSGSVRLGLSVITVSEFGYRRVQSLSATASASEWLRFVREAAQLF